MSAAWLPVRFGRSSVGKKGKALRVELPDTDARAVVYVAGEMPSGWGFRADGSHVTLEDGLGKRADRDLLMKSTKARRQHPLFAYVAFGILREVLSRRMFSELREQANLSYEANFKIHSFDNLHGGYYIATVRQFFSPLLQQKTTKGERGRKGPCDSGTASSSPGKRWTVCRFFR